MERGINDLCTLCQVQENIPTPESCTGDLHYELVPLKMTNDILMFHNDKLNHKQAYTLMLDGEDWKPLAWHYKKGSFYFHMGPERATAWDGLSS